MDDEELGACIHLSNCLKSKIDFDEVNTPEIKQFLLSMVIEKPPQTTFITKEGTLKRDPGFMKSYRDVICVITTEGFFHGFNLRSDKDPIFTMNCRKAKVLPRKGPRFDMSEEVKGFFSSNLKVSFKAESMIEMEDWIKALTQFNIENAK